MSTLKYIILTVIAAVVWQQQAVILRLVGLAPSSSSDGKGCPFGFKTGDGVVSPHGDGVVSPHGSNVSKSTSDGGQPVSDSDRTEQPVADTKQPGPSPAQRVERGQMEKIRVLRPEEVASNDGSTDGLPLHLIVLGEVYDVTAGESMYKEGYKVFLGKDSSRAFHDGEFERSVEDVRDLSAMALLDVTGWREFYRLHEKYTFVGVLEGLYYDAQGRPTSALGEVEAMAKKGTEAREIEEHRLKVVFPTCKYERMPHPDDKRKDPVKRNRRSCHFAEEKDGIERYVMWLTWKHVGTGNTVHRCACVTREAIDNKPDWVDSITNFETCPRFVKECWK